VHVMRQKNKQLYGIDTLKIYPPMISTHSKLIFVAMLSVLSNGCAQYSGGLDCAALSMQTMSLSVQIILILVSMNRNIIW